MGRRVGSKLCPLCRKHEDHEHVLRHCRFSALCFDTVRNAFGLVQREGGSVELSHLLFDEPLLSPSRSQGLVLWAALNARWTCAVRRGTRTPPRPWMTLWPRGWEFWRYRAISHCPRWICNTCWPSCCPGLRGACFSNDSRQREFSQHKKQQHQEMPNSGNGVHTETHT